MFLLKGSSIKINLPEDSRESLAGWVKYTGKKSFG
jgi:hypothetical protein